MAQIAENGEDGIFPLLRREWIGTNSNGVLVGLAPRDGVNVKTVFTAGFAMFSGMTMRDIEDEKQSVDPNDFIYLRGVSIKPAFKISDYRGGDNKSPVEGVLLSTNKLRIYFPEKPLGTVDFYPKP